MTHASNALEAMLVNVVCRSISEPVPPGQQAAEGSTPEMHPPTDGANEGLNEGVFVGFKEGFRVGLKVGN